MPRRRPASAREMLEEAERLLVGTFAAPSAGARTVLPLARPNDRVQIVPIVPPHDGPLPELDSREVEGLIRALATRRTQMRPSVPVRPPPSTPVWFDGSFRCAVLPMDGMPGFAALLIRHSGLGWLRFELTPRQAAGLRNQLEAVIGPRPPRRRARRAAALRADP